MKDVSTAAVYVSPSGDDSNSGMTAAESVKSIMHAIELCYQMGHTRSKIYLAAGNYGTTTEYENIWIENRSIHMYLMDGNVTINGIITVKRNAYLYIGCDENNEYTLTINNDVSKTTGASFYLSGDASAIIDVKLFVNQSNGGHCIDVNSSSFMYFYNDVEMTGNNVNKFILCFNNALTTFAKNVNIKGDGNYGVHVERIGCVIFNENIDMSTATITNQAFRINGNSCIAIPNPNKQIYLKSHTTGSNPVIEIRHGSYLYIEGPSNLTVEGVSSGNIVLIDVEDLSTLLIKSGVTSSINLKLPSGGTGARGISALYNSVVQFACTASTTFNISGTYGVVFRSSAGSFFEIAKNMVFSGSPTGQRYACVYGGCIDVSGKGANRIPGSTAGTADATWYSYYG